jgi:PGF-CTERM protein
MVVALMTALVASAFVAAPATALSADASVDDTAPGAVGDYRVTLRPEAGDAVVENGLKSVTLDFSADRDFSGDLGNLSDRDVEIRVGDGNGTVPAGEASVNQSGSEVTVTLERAFTGIEPGDRIVVNVYGVTNTEIAIQNPQSLRGFALDVSATGPQGNTSGPVEARYTIDPNATAQRTPTDSADNSNASGATNANGSTNDTDTGTDNSTETDTGSTATATETATATATATPTATVTAAPIESDSTSTAAAVTAVVETIEPTETTTTEETSTDTATETAEPTEASTMTEEATEPATTGGDESGGQATDTTGPGFGLLVALVALLAAGLLATRRRD